MKPTYIIDIDGTILEHLGSLEKQINASPNILAGVKNVFNDMYLEDAVIILLSGRKESSRERTEEQLRNAGIQYDQLILGAGRGKRVLINDAKPNSQAETAIGITVPRNGNLEESIKADYYKAHASMSETEESL